MGRYATSLGFAVILLWPAFAVAEPPAEAANEPTVTIPLAQVWALEMPGTRPMNVLRRAGTYIAPEGAIVDDIRKSLGDSPALSPAQRERCLGVLGSGDAALLEAGKVLTGASAIKRSFPAGKPVSVVLYSGSADHRFEVVEVTRYFDSAHIKTRGNAMEVRLRLRPIKDGEAAKQLAIIPLGEMPSGILHVKIEASTLGDGSSTSGKGRADDIEWGHCSFSGFKSIAIGAGKPEPIHSTWPVQSETIPINSIYGWQVPGTIEFKDTKAIDRIRQADVRGQEKSPKPKMGFAVSGTGMEALRRAHDVIVQGKSPKEQFPSDSELNAVFYSGTSGTYVHLVGITRSGNDIQVRYRLTPHTTAQVTEHIALIPLGKLMPGKYRVNIVRAPTESKYRKLGFEELPQETADQIVCHSFSFVVSGEGTD